MPPMARKTLALIIVLIIVGGVFTQWGLLLDVAKLDPFGLQQWLFCEQMRIARMCQWINSSS